MTSSRQALGTVGEPLLYVGGMLVFQGVCFLFLTEPLTSPADVAAAAASPSPPI